MKLSKLDQISEKYGLHKYGNSGVRNEIGTANLIDDCLTSITSRLNGIIEFAKYAGKVSDKTNKILRKSFTYMSRNDQIRFHNYMYDLKSQINNLSNFYEELINKANAVEEIIEVEKEEQSKVKRY